MYIVAILFFVCAIGAFGSPIEQDQSKWDEKVKDCMKVYNVTPEEFKNLPVSDSISLIFICGAKIFGQLNEDGTVNKEKILSLKKEEASAEEVSKIIEKCNSVKVNHNDLREEMKYMECFQKEGLSDLINPIEI